MKGKVNSNEKRTVYSQQRVKEVGVGNTVIVSSKQGPTKDIIPDIIPSDGSLKPGLKVIAKDVDQYYGGQLRSRVNESTWEIQSHEVTWSSDRADIRVIEKPEFCF